MYFPESSIITTKDGLQFQAYSNEHPEGYIIAKPKYIPTDKISSDALPYRFILGRRVNRLNFWADKEKLKEYIANFSKAYPDYIFKSDIHDNKQEFFAVPVSHIDKIYSPKEGLNELMKIPKSELDEHLKKVVELIDFLLESGVDLKDIGITYSTVMGYYSQNMSDINIVIYGKNNFWKIMRFLEKNSHPDLRWKNYDEWRTFYKKRNRYMIHDSDIYIKNMYRKKSEGFFKESLFVIFAVENENESAVRWGEEKYYYLGKGKFKAIVKSNWNSVVRPGFYELTDSKFLEGEKNFENIEIKKVVFHSRDYCMLAYPGEEIEISGILERVVSKTGGEYYQIILGYHDSYINGNSEHEYIKIFRDNTIHSEKEEINPECVHCTESNLNAGDITEYGSIIIYKNGDDETGWFATISPVTGGDVKKDFTIQIMPNKHINHISDISRNLELSKNYGIAFSKISKAITEVMKEERRDLENDEKVLRIGTYGKSKHPQEHFHIKLFPWTGEIGQPYTPDSTFGKKEIFTDEIGEEFVKMKPIRKKSIDKERLEKLAQRFIMYLM